MTARLVEPMDRGATRRPRTHIRRRPARAPTSSPCRRPWCEHADARVPPRRRSASAPDQRPLVVRDAGSSPATTSRRGRAEAGCDVHRAVVGATDAGRGGGAAHSTARTVVPAPGAVSMRREVAVAELREQPHARHAGALRRGGGIEADPVVDDPDLDRTVEARRRARRWWPVARGRRRCGPLPGRSGRRSSSCSSRAPARDRRRSRRCTARRVDRFAGRGAQGRGERTLTDARRRSAGVAGGDVIVDPGTEGGRPHRRS